MISLIVFIFSCFQPLISTANQLLNYEVWFKEKAAPFSGQSIKVLGSSGFGFEKALTYAGKKFEKLTGIKVEVCTTPEPELHPKIVASYIAGFSPYDAACVSSWFIPQVFSSGAFNEVRPLLNSDLAYPELNMGDFVQADIKYGCTWPIGKTLYALPYFSDIALLFCNTSYLDKTGFQPPTTWEDYEKIAKALYERDLNNDGKPEYGIVFAGKKDIDLPMHFYARFASYGGEWFDKEMKPAFNNPIGVKAINMLKEHLKYSIPGSTALDMSLADQAWINGEAAIYEGWTHIPILANSPARSKIVGKWDATVIPKGTRYGPLHGGWVLGLPKYAKHTSAAFLFLQYCTTKEIMKEVVLNVGLTQARMSVLLDPECLKKFPWYKALVDSENVAAPPPKVAEIGEVWDIYMTYISKAISGKESAEKVLGEWYNKLYRLMEKAGYYKK